MPFDPSIGKATQFKPGQSGNPSGKSKARARAESIFDSTSSDAHIRRVLKVVREQAEAGEPWAIEMLMKRLLPATERREVEQVEAAPVHELEAALARIEALAGADTPTADAEPRRTNGSSGGLQ